MEIKSVKYTGSFPSEKTCPDAKLAEYAFIGRSNVGKSSLINMLCDKKDLARVSKEPGKTQMLNFFYVDDRWFLVDLPGFGYAKVSKSKRKIFRNMIQGYLKYRGTLQCVFLLIDIRVPPQKIDLEFINWMGSQSIPFVIVFTKADKMNGKKQEEQLAAFEAEMLKEWTELPQVFITSAIKGTGKDEILSFIEEINSQYNKMEAIS